MADIESYPDSRRVKDAIQKDIKGDLEELNAEVAAIKTGSGVLVSSGDSTVGYLDGKLVAGNGMTFTKGNAGQNETLTLRVEISLVATEASLGTGSVDGELRICADTGNRYTWDDSNAKWRIMPGNVYSSDPSPATYTIETGTVFYNISDEQLKRWNSTAWVDYADDAGFYKSIAIVEHSVATGSHGGDAVADTWNIRTINTIQSDPDNILSLSSNQITLDAGTYKVVGWSVADNVGKNQAALYNTVSGNYVIIGSSGLSNSSYPTTSKSQIEGYITVNASEPLELRHYTELSKSNKGLGRDTGSGQNNIFARIIFSKIRT